MVNWTRFPVTAAGHLVKLSPMVIIAWMWVKCASN